MDYKKIFTISLLAFCGAIFYTNLSAQCATWTGSPDEDAAAEAHSIYRQALKANDMEVAFENWERAYKIAPAADGKRDFHFTDGIKLYKHKLENETDAEKKKVHIETILGLYDDAIACLENGTIKFKDEATTKAKIQRLYSDKTFDHFYTFNSLYSKTYAACEKVLEVSGNDLDYRIFTPYATIAVDYFKKEKIDKDQARGIHDKLMSIVDYNKENNETYGPYYVQQGEVVKNIFSKIKNDIFDCDFFINELKPQYDADPNNPELAKEIIQKLRRRGCEDSNPFVSKLLKQYEQWAAKTNASKQASFEANNPALLANKAYKAGDYQTALMKYKEAISAETDPSKQASYHMSIASIQFRKMNKYGEARASARKAASLRGNWGKPYMLIGDMYAKSSRSCGKGAYGSGVVVLAAIEKWSYAKSIDPSVAGDAGSKISKYNQYIPPQEEAFMQGKKAGQKVNTGCWIGESVTLRFK